MQQQQQETCPSSPRARRRLVKCKQREAQGLLLQAVRADERGDAAQALALYRSARGHLDAALAIPCDDPQCTGSKWDETRRTQAKMQESLLSMQSRVQDLEARLEPRTTSMVPSAPLLPASTLRVPPRPSVPPVSSGNPNCGHLYPQIAALSEKAPLPPGGVWFESAGQPPPLQGLPLAPPSPQRLPPALPCYVATGSTDLPPMYTPQPVEGHTSLSMGTAHGELLLLPPGYAQCQEKPSGLQVAPVQQVLGPDAVELFLIADGAQIFFVSVAGLVSAPSYPGFLRIATFRSQGPDAPPGRPPAFLQVSGWLHPLVPGSSPVLRSSQGIYVFPDMCSGEAGATVGVLLSPELPAEQRRLFEEHLGRLAQFCVQAPEDGAAGGQAMSADAPKAAAPDPEKGTPQLMPEWSEKMSHGILSGASWISRGLLRGAEATGKVLNKGATAVREHIPAESQVPPQALANARPTAAAPPAQAPSAAEPHRANPGPNREPSLVKAGKSLVGGVVDAMSSVSKEVAPHLKRYGEKIMPESLKQPDSDGARALHGAKMVASSSAQGLSTIWDGLSSAAKTIARSVSSSTVQPVSQGAASVPSDRNAQMSGHYQNGQPTMNDIERDTGIKRQM
uniref:Spartin-like n=1 Tax=Petromyzon marinus TaxID=7757 RepID=A0AAJ7T6W1_PETMA|nr:spartin-like [Petromyzon marinus]XP_032812473.1 spartin-like [Petromyzon marinus]XP_032812474.1 spartin-like [Petromyzon marinus]